MPIPPDNRVPGDDHHVDDHNDIADELTALAAANAALVPKTQTQPTSGGVGVSTQTFQFTPAGTTDTSAPFSELFSTQIYGSSPPITETAWISGYNLPASYGASGYSSAAGSVYSYIHPDAGDTNVAGAHGIEWGVAVAGPAFAWQVNAFQVIAVDDSDQSVGVTFRFSSGTSDATDNTMQFINAKTGTIDLRFNVGVPGRVGAEPSARTGWYSRRPGPGRTCSSS